LGTAGRNENLEKLEVEVEARVAGVTEWWQHGRGGGNRRRKEVNYTTQVVLYTEDMFGGYIYIYIKRIRWKLDEGK